MNKLTRQGSIVSSNSAITHTGYLTPSALRGVRKNSIVEGRRRSNLEVFPTFLENEEFEKENVNSNIIVFEGQQDVEMVTKREVILKGNLHNLSGLGISWNKRYCEFDGDSFRYSKKEGSPFKLEIKVLFATFHHSIEYPNRFCFLVKDMDHKNCLIFDCIEAAERDNWVQILNDVTNRSKYVPKQVEATVCTPTPKSRPTSPMNPRSLSIDIQDLPLSGIMGRRFSNIPSPFNYTPRRSITSTGCYNTAQCYSDFHYLNGLSNQLVK